MVYRVLYLDEATLHSSGILLGKYSVKYVRAVDKHMAYRLSHKWKWDLIVDGRYPLVAGIPGACEG